MKFLKDAISIVLAALLALGTGASAQEAPSAMEEAFYGRDWTTVDRLLAQGDLSPRELSLGANALWTQRRWEPALELMRTLEGVYPDEVVPYARLLQVLALERLGHPSEAYDLALELYQSEPPKSVQYYSAYALSRITSNAEEAEKWLHRMAELASTSVQQRTALVALAARERLSPTEALALLKIQNRNSKALALAQGAPASPERDYRVGYGLYLAKRYDEAIPWLQRLDPMGLYGEGGSYYLALSLAQEGRLSEAQRIYEELVFRENGDYYVRSLRQLAQMLNGPAAEEALAVLQRAASGDDRPRASVALNYLATSQHYNRRDQAKSELLRRFPDSSYATEIIWNDGWALWVQGDRAGALRIWNQAKPQNSDSNAPRLLYWRSRALEALNRTDEAQQLREELLNRHCLSVYSFLVLSGGSLQIAPEGLPEDFAQRNITELERWGFMVHAQLELAERTDTPSRLSAAFIAWWIGSETQAYHYLRPLLNDYLQANPIARPLLEMAYPRPFRSQVEAAAAQWQVDPLLIWAIMRQESAFNPDATSRAGAAGLMQLMPGTASDVARMVGLTNYNVYNVEDNIAMGTAHVNQLQQSYDSIEWVLAAYNAGSGNVNRWNREREEWAPDSWVEAIPFQETRNYVKAVMSNYQVYQRLYGAQDQGS